MQATSSLHQTIYSYGQLEPHLLQYTPGERSLIKAAFEFAKKMHESQTRRSGEPYVTHPLSVAKIVASLHLDSDSVIGALLHDVVEDSEITIRNIRKHFNEDVTRIVKGLTKLSSMQIVPNDETHTQNLVHLLLNMVQDSRVMVIKLADRLHNMSTLGALPREKQILVAEETLSLFIPLAESLGIGMLTQQLEEYAYQFKDPTLYNQIKSYVIQQVDVSELRQFESTAQQQIEKNKIKASINARIKSIPSLYKKIVQDLKPVEGIYDLFGLRIVCKNTHDCYKVLGIAHALWTPLEGRVKDYIALPKKNGYQSLHTTVLGPQGRSIEIQIRTEKMHTIAENGLAAHWRYKQKDNPINESLNVTLSYLQDVQKQNYGELETIPSEALQDQLTVFTPMGDPIQLPPGSTVLDFAFKVHTEIGLHAASARINGRQVRLAEFLSNTDMVEIITSKESHPHTHWIHHVTTSHARSRLTHWLNNNAQNSIIQGNIIIQFDYRKICKYLGQETPNISIKYSPCCNIHATQDLFGTLRKNAIIEVHAKTCKIGQKNRWAPPVRISKISSPLTNAIECTIHLQNKTNLFSQLEKIATMLSIRLKSLTIDETERGEIDAKAVLTHVNDGDLEKLRRSIRAIPTFISLQYIGRKVFATQNDYNTFDSI